VLIYQFTIEYKAFIKPYEALGKAIIIFGIAFLLIAIIILIKKFKDDY